MLNMITFISLISRLGMVNAKSVVDMPVYRSDFSSRPYRNRSIRLGYVRLFDAAPVIVADYLGMFRDAGLQVEVSREVGWATIRDKLAFGELDVAQALSPIPFAMQFGMGVVPTQMVAGMILNTNGNAVTLSSRFWDQGIENGDSLRRYIKDGYRARKLVLGVVSLYSSHHFTLCRWLEDHGIDPKVDVIISVLPPEQMVRNMASGNIDGFCVGEPWNSIAVEEGIGWCPTTSKLIASGYPEKVLVTTERFFSYRPDDYIALIRVLLSACEYCESPDRRSALFKILSRPEYLNCSRDTLSHALSGKFPMGHGQFSEGAFVRFYGEGVNCPNVERAKLVCQDLQRYMPNAQIGPITNKMISSIYRASIFEQAESPAVL